jgi:hypothetical protein
MKEWLKVLQTWATMVEEFGVTVNAWIHHLPGRLGSVL